MARMGANVTTPHTAYGRIRLGLHEAISHAHGAAVDTRQQAGERIDVADLRQRLNLSQDRLAACFGVTVGTVRRWERGQQRPRGPAQVLLNLIQRDPKWVLKALA